MKNSLAIKKAAKTRQGQRQVIRARGEQREGTSQHMERLRTRRLVIGTLCPRAQQISTQIVSQSSGDKESRPEPP